MTDSDSDAFSVNTKFCRFCDAFLIGNGITTVTSTASLDSIADDLARDEGLRYVYATHMVKAADLGIGYEWAPITHQYGPAFTRHGMHWLHKSRLMREMR